MTFLNAAGHFVSTLLHHRMSQFSIYEILWLESGEHSVMDDLDCNQVDHVDVAQHPSCEHQQTVSHHDLISTGVPVVNSEVCSDMYMTYLQSIFLCIDNQAHSQTPVLSTLLSLVHTPNAICSPINKINIYTWSDDHTPKPHYSPSHYMVLFTTDQSHFFSMFLHDLVLFPSVIPAQIPRITWNNTHV